MHTDTDGATAARPMATPLARTGGTVARRGVSRVAWGILLVGLAIEAALWLGLVFPAGLFGQRWAIRAVEPLAAILGPDITGLARFAAVLLTWVAGYAVALTVCRRGLSPAARGLLAALPVLFAGTLWFMLPVSSQDVYHYTMEGRLFSVHGANPLTTPPAAYPADPLAWTVRAWSDTPSRYGPLFALVAAGVTRATGDSLTATLLGFKLLMTAALFGTAALAYFTVRRIDPAAALPAYVFVAWNPLALYEAAANAHNDLLMVLFTALALYLWLRGRLDLALPALALGALVKYVVVILAPLLLVAAFAAAGAGTGRRVALRRAMVGAALALGLCVAAYAPFWEGRVTFGALTAASGGMISSPGWLLREALAPAVGAARAGLAVMVTLACLFGAGYVGLLVRLRRASRERGPADRSAIALTCVLALALWLATVSWWLWPWYALWLLPPAALRRPHGRTTVVVAVATCAALLAYLPTNFHLALWPLGSGGMSLTVALLLFLPAFAAALLLLRQGPTAHRSA